MIVSKCCKAPVSVSVADEGTQCYVCTKCNQYCDGFDTTFLNRMPISPKSKSLNKIYNIIKTIYEARNEK